MIVFIHGFYLVLWSFSMQDLLLLGLTRKAIDFSPRVSLTQNAAVFGDVRPSDQALLNRCKSDDESCCCCLHYLCHAMPASPQGCWWQPCSFSPEHDGTTGTSGADDRWRVRPTTLIRWLPCTLAQSCNNGWTAQHQTRDNQGLQQICVDSCKEKCRSLWN